jgi:hypothetical protein
MSVKEKLSGDMESQSPSLVLIWQTTIASRRQSS